MHGARWTGYPRGMPRLLDRLDAAQRAFRPAAFAVAVWRKAGDDSAGYLSVLLSFYAFLAVFPLLLVLATVLGLLLRNDPHAQQSVLHSALSEFPVIGTQLKANIHSLSGTGFGLTVGLIGTAWGARGLSAAAQWACNTVWQIPYTRRPSWLHRQGRGLALLAVIVVDVLANGTLTTVSGVSDGHSLAVEWIGAIVSTLVNAAFFTLGLRLAIAKEVPVWSFLRAACATAVVWQALLSLGSYLVGHELRHAEDLYGVFGIVLGLIAWLNVQARVTLYLLEADCVRARKLWPRTLDGPRLVPGDLRAFESYAKAQQRRSSVRISIDYIHPDGLNAYDEATSQWSAGTRSSTPSKSTVPAKVPKASP